jgi:hypothetical protein
MANEAVPGSGMARADVELGGPGWRLRTRLTAPAGRTDRRQLLPRVRALSDASADAAQRGSEKQGQPVSCRAGCAACCRQIVLLSETEARYLRDLVEGPLEPRRALARARFKGIDGPTESRKDMSAAP